MKKLILILLLFISVLTFSQDKVKFIAGGVTCSMCSNAIHKSLHQDKNIIDINPNLETQEWFLVYKKGAFKLESLKSKVEDAGFSINKVWLNNELVYSRETKKKSSLPSKNKKATTK